MKKGILLVTCALLALSGCGKSDKSAEAIEKYGSDTLKLYNWGVYRSDNLLSDFEKEFGVKVIEELYASNEEMYMKLQAGDAYDVLVPSDYMIERLIQEDKIQKLDKTMIPNLENIYDGVKGLSYDPNNDYSAPYFWGSVGIVYNSANVPTELIEKEGFNIFRNKDYSGRVYMYDSERDSFMIALKALGYSMNTENDAEIQEAYEWLNDVNNTMEPVYVTDEVIDNMVGGMKDLAVVYSGDAAYILSENEDMRFIMPNEGTNIWSDGMVIPTNAKNPKLANEFINFVLTYESSYGNSSTVGYASGNKDVIADMTAVGGEYEGNEAYLPRTGYANDEVFKHNEVLKKKLSDLWLKVKAQQ